MAAARDEVSGSGQEEAEDIGRVRPPAKIFKPEEIRSWDGLVQSQSQGGRRAFFFEGEQFIDGLRHKQVSTRGLRWDESVVPTMAELERFKNLGATQHNVANMEETHERALVCTR